MAARWKGEAPELLAFFIPLDSKEIWGSETEPGFLTQLGFKEPTGRGWYYNEPNAMMNLVRLGLEDMNMFYKPLFLHNESIVDFAKTDENKLEGFEISELVGKVRFEKTALPRGTPWQGLLVVALDPLKKTPDIDRTDNVFVQYVTVNGTDAAGNYIEDQPVCKVEPSGKGKDAYITFNNFYDEQKRVFFKNQDKNGGIKQVWSKESNEAQVVSQLGRMRSSDI